MVGTDKQGLRHKLYLKWKNNSHNIRGILERHLSPTKTNDISKELNDERLEVCIRMVLLSNEMRTSLISSIVLRDICVRIQENDSTAKLFSSELV